MVIDPTLMPHVVGFVVTVAGREVILLKVMVSELISGAPRQELNVVLMTYCVEGTFGGQILGKEMSRIPGIVVDVSPLATNTPPSVNNCALMKLELPPFGVKRYPSLEAFQEVAFLPGAATAKVLVKSCIPSIPLFELVAETQLLFSKKMSISPVDS